MAILATIVTFVGRTRMAARRGLSSHPLSLVCFLLEEEEYEVPVGPSHFLTHRLGVPRFEPNPLFLPSSDARKVWLGGHRNTGLHFVSLSAVPWAVMNYFPDLARG